MRIWIFLITVFLQHTLSARVIFVDKSGSNSNNGFSKTTTTGGVGPKATVTAALLIANRFDTISINNGTYLESVKLSNDVFIGANGLVTLKSLQVNGNYIKIDLIGGDIIIKDSLILTNGEFFIKSQGNLFLSSSCEIQGGGQSSFINGRIFRIFDQFSGIMKFPLGCNHSYRPVLVEMVDNVSKTDTLSIEMIDSGLKVNKLSGIRNLNNRYHCQIKFFQSSKNRFRFTQYFGNYFLNDQVLDTANLKLVFIQSGNYIQGGFCDSLSNGNGRVSAVFNSNRLMNYIALCNLSNGSNALGNDGIFAFFQPDKTSYCLGEMLKLQNVTIVNGSGIKSCVWYFDYPKSGRRNSQTSINTNYILRDTGLLNVWLIVTDSLLRMDTFVTKVFVRSTKAKLNISNLCMGGKSILYISGLVAGSYGVSWYKDSVFESMDDTLVIAKLDEARIHVSILVQSLNEQCEYFLDSQLIGVPLPKLKFVNITDSCTSDFIWCTPEIEKNTLASSYKYQWYIDGMKKDSVVKFKYLTTNVFKQKLKLRVLNQFNCASTFDTFLVKKILKLESPKISINCKLESIAVKLSVKSSVSSNYLSYWYVNDSLYYTSKDSIGFSRMLNGTKYKVVTKNDMGCYDSSLLDLSKFNKSGLQLIVKDKPGCLNDSLHLVVMRSSILDTTGSFKINNDLYTFNPVKIKILTEGVQSVVWQTTNYGCVDTLSKNVFYTKVPVHQIKTEQNGVFQCAGDKVELKVVGIDPKDTLDLFQSIYTDKIKSNVGRLSYATDVAGELTFYSVVRNENSGCQFRDTITINVNQPPIIKVVFDSLVCFSKNSKIESFDISQSKSKYLKWRINLNKQDYYTSSHDFGILAVGNYQGFVKATDSFGCNDSDRISLKVLKLPNYSLKINGQMPICFGDSILVDLTSSDGTIFWENIRLNVTPITLKKSGTYHWEVQGFNNCSIFDSILVISDTSLKLTKTKDTTIFAGEPLMLTASGASTYKWSPNKYIRSIQGTSLIVKPSSDITYRVIGTSIWGCQIKDSVKIMVIKNTRLKIPNILTINGDGYNEKWDLSMIKDIENYTIHIYDSQMKLIKELKNYKNDYSFNNQSAGLYHYTIQGVNRSVFKGSIDVLK
jgi:gliding motility-associated-like protein